MISVELNGVLYTQNSYYHIIGEKDGEIIFHAKYNKKLTESELLNYAKIVDQLLGG